MSLNNLDIGNERNLWGIVRYFENFDFDWNISLYNRNTWGGALSKTGLDTALDDSLDGFIGLQYDQAGRPIDGNISTIKTNDIIIDPLDFKDIFIINTNLVN